ncbi:Uracil phosphoribosyltransferase, synthesizes UMP from uracil [Friedmanniomyces endolithicus]|uniref:uracil phosphoribosyltransferase n=1 Tax=Friedmanniomyces endolithicus TaxID=329885 RepID=A0AAN6FU86_9PEZI|nr:Uracil phosphoribosyltransferase, synthesizes UMP from uracil [Friedmanniomyces endolithicus]KAK0280823.1 Uracil phosphoribosyltransferase, synthesizes UMP from uracil [Friedmanniomyces endolithicus]KAK0281012.1 Uracil phosphoribosyltransferase, synthesizes UMP from uracil [Friedmanniomyces endolithicus]KAK0324627.1 Uracil phosphoribosyltransferase, synthesizes UMP from uracil [Friedmanniomyces endolithicus]KAK0932102.1 Uracil phosphoribosyltransferase, synthesizes UMP from uracil [Friedmann
MSKQSQPDDTTQRAPSDHLGPDYKPTDQKPTATVSTKVAHENVTVLPQTPQLIALLTMIRDKSTNRADFIFYSNRINRLLVEEALNHLPVHPHTVTTPVGRPYAGVAFEGKICGVSIMRAGEAMEQALRECCRSVRIGKILIQRDEETSKPRLFYDKLPEDVGERWVLLLDPMLATGAYLSSPPEGCIRACATQEIQAAAVCWWEYWADETLLMFAGGSALMAVDVLRSKGVPESRICFLNLIASPEGAANFAQKFPKVRIVTAFVDEGLNEKKYVFPLPHPPFATAARTLDLVDGYKQVRFA